MRMAAIAAGLALAALTTIAQAQQRPDYGTAIEAAATVNQRRGGGARIAARTVVADDAIAPAHLPCRPCATTPQH